MSDSDKKFEQLEKRIRGTENALAALTASITHNTNNTKENMADLRTDMKDNRQELRDIKDSMQHLYISQSGDRTKINFNEKVVWAGAISLLSAGLYLLQEFIKAGGAG